MAPPSETVELGGLPHGLALLDGTLYVTDRSVGEVRRLRIGDRGGEWTELTPLHGGAWPHAVGVMAPEAQTRRQKAVVCWSW